MTARSGPTMLRLRAASQRALVVAAGKKAEALRRTASGEHVLVVYEAGAARLYSEPRSAPKVKGAQSGPSSHPWPNLWPRGLTASRFEAPC